MAFTVKLPDGSQRGFDAPVTGAELANSISKSLAKNAYVIRVNGELWDLSRTLPEGASVAILTRDSEEGLDTLRHDTAHVMAEAVQELWPGTKVTIGPTIENGFYYDFDREEPFRPEDLEAIEARMREIMARGAAFDREVWSRDDAIEHFRSAGEKYKVELIENLPAAETITIYKQGNWMDLCRGPHGPGTKAIGVAFKLMKVAGAYWRGDSRNRMLQRIYGTAWRTEQELKDHLHQLEEAEKRDHRKLGKEMDLFHFQEEAPGAVFWHHKGWVLFQKLIDYMRRRQETAGYIEVSTPTVMDRAMWETSGHWFNYRQNMYTTTTEDDRVFALKPMNCPGSVSVYKADLKSYRDLPLRMAEFGRVHRYEASGALHGLMRVREFTQDDAHIYCTEEQMQEECETVIRLIMDIYAQFGFTNVRIKFSDRPENRIGSDATWDKLEGALKGALEDMGFAYTLNPGEGAFYGPKLEFVLRDAIGRDWQCGTLQVDLNLPERFDANYIGEDGERHRPVMLHRALFGSLERFTGILIEHYAGKLPLWLAPVQAVIATIVSDADDYAYEVAAQLRKAGLRVEVDTRNEKINYKVREHSHNKVPFILAVGKREVEERTVAVRRLGEEGQKVQSLADAVALLADEARDPIQRAEQVALAAE
ncbi:threonine--tRNA ligase [Radicibacter daui]|uniref:threonine--tRNA ligase n=1 Tax=Radicibacter daui TaxID=3064829 RepID=UPI0040469FD3